MRELCTHSYTPYTFRVFVKPKRILHGRGGCHNLLVTCFSPVFSTFRLALPIGKSDMLVSGSVPHQKVEQGVETRNFLVTPGTEVYRPNCRGASDKTHRLLVIHPCTGECRACIVKLPWLSDLHGTTTTCRSCLGLESRNPLLTLTAPTHAFMSASQGDHRLGVILSSGIHESFPLRPAPLRS